jgi:hypothetical protein
MNCKRAELTTLHTGSELVTKYTTGLKIKHQVMPQE